MDHIEWYTEEIKEYYCAEINQTIANGRIYYLSQNGNKGYVICSDWTNKKNLILSFGVFEETAIALRKEGSFFSTKMNLYDINDSSCIGSLDNSYSNGFYLRNIRYKGNGNWSSIFKRNPDFKMKFEICSLNSDVILSLNADKIKKKWYHRLYLSTTALKGNISIKGEENRELFICSFFCMHNYFVQLRDV